MGLLVAAAVAYLAIGLAQQGVGLLTTWVGLKVGWEATNHLRTDLVAHCLRLDMPFHKTHTPGELIERIDGDVTALAQFFSYFVVRLAGGLLLTLAILFLVFRENAGAGLLLTVYVVTVLSALLLVQRLGKKRWLAAREAWANQSSFVEEYYVGTEDVRGVGAEAEVLGRLERRLVELTHKVRGGRMADALSFAITNFLYVVGYGLGLALGAWLYLRGDVTIGGAFLLVTYVGMLSSPLEELRTQSQVLQQASAGAQRIEDLRCQASSMGHQPPYEAPTAAGADLAAPAAIEMGPQAVRFAAVSFAYEDSLVEAAATGVAESPRADAGSVGGNRIRALHDISITVTPGRVLGVLGRTGSGKTTLARLLFRLYEPSSGAIYLGDRPLTDLPLAELRQYIGMVTQDVQLFDATLRHNITFFDDTITDTRIEAALLELGLLDWLHQMPGKLDTRLVAGGQSISAGEAQLLAFTRLLLRNPGVIILDEATSRLDPVTERRLEAAIDRLLLGRTAIVIAHRLHTLQRADDILILESGRVVEYGPRVALVADPASRFARLLHSGLEEVLV
jgi:ABC-type multidrug transport system fused ATPase/permease subunit